MKWIAMLGAAALMSQSALAAESVQRSTETSSRPSVAVKIDSGLLRVEAWDKSEVRLEGTLDDEVEDFEFRAMGDDAVDIVIEEDHGGAWSTNWGGDWGGGSDTALTLYVPALSSLDIEGVNVSTELINIEGPVALEAVNGGIRATGLQGAAELTTVNGPIEVTASRNDLEVGSVNGSITIRDASGERLALNVVNGDLNVESTARDVEVEAVSGDVDLMLDSVDRLEIDAVSGDVNSTLHLESNGRVSANAVSGDIDFYLVKPLNLRVEAESMSGDLDNHISDVEQTKGLYSLGRSLQFTVGDASARVQVNTVSGDVQLHAADG